MSNYQEIVSPEELPEPDCCLVEIAQSQADARQYAEAHPERQVYWVASLHVAVWFERRVVDADLRMAAVA